MNSLETIEVYRDAYYGEMDRAFELSSELAELQGTIKALAKMKSNPDFVFDKLKEMAESFEKEVDTVA